MPAVPYAPSTAFLGAEKAKLSSREGERRRVALIADGIGSMHGVTHTIEQIRERGVPGFEVDVIGTDPGVDRRLPAAAELEVPFYEGMRLGVPGLPDLVETLAEGGYDLVHVTAPGPAGIAATLLSRVTGVPLLASYHTELAAYAGLRSGDGGLEAIARRRPRRLLRRPPRRPLAEPRGRRLAGRARHRPGPDRPLGARVDIARFDPAKADRDAYPGELKVLYAGRLTREKGVDLLAESFLRAQRSDPRLHLLLAGGGPRGGGAAGAARRARDLPRLARRRGAGLRLRQRRRLPLRQQHRHLRPGDPRGRRQRARRSSPSPRVARRRWSRTATPACSAAPTPTTWPVPCCSSPPRRCCATTSAPPPPTPPAPLLGAVDGPARGRLPARARRRPGGGAAAGRPGRLTRRGGTVPQYDGSIDDPAIYFNRELSWLDFNQRVLELAEDPEVPLLERLRFCGIYASNLDEFFMVRVAGLFDQLDAGIDARGPDGLAPSEQIDAIQARVLELDRRLHACFGGVLRPALEEEGIRIVSLETASEEERREIDARFHEQVFPALTPLVIGLGRPFPYISNLSLSLGVLLRDPESGVEIIARVKVPKELLGRFLPVGEDGKAFVPLEEAIAANLDALFPGTEVIDHGYFRVTRDADFTVSDEADDLLQAVQDELRRRRFGEVVRLEIAAGMNPKLREQLIDALRLEDREVYDVDGLVDLGDLNDIADVPGHAELRYRPGPRSRSRACRARTRSRSTCSRRSASATCSSTIPTTPSPPRSSASSSRRSPTPTCWRSSTPSTGPATTRRWSRR